MITVSEARTAPASSLDLATAIRTRRAVRSYLPSRVPAAAIEELLAAAVQAPSAMNAQPWGFVIVQHRERLARYSRQAKQRVLEAHAAEAKTSRYRPLLEDEHFDILYGADALIVICAPSASPYAAADCWLAAQNLMLSACAMGLGSCPIGFAVPWLGTPEARAELGMPGEYAAFAPIVVGFPSSTPPAVGRGAPRILTWIR